jgi:AhpD family alkylhydroperoxidase
MVEIPSYLEDYEPRDPDFIQLVCLLRDKAQSEGALDEKTKRLILLALASVSGNRRGVANHAKEAKKLGATDDQLIEVIRLVFIHHGIPGLQTATAAFSLQE